uniref:Trans-1,2-dihydrobenzene-1,2-diol dehydrogenase n=1 Tax=Sander lucioperca TaxID=283035 RepID=A0A8C9XYG2_SANLU
SGLEWGLEWELSGMRRSVIASRSLERAKEFANRHGIPKAYGSYEELANDPDVGEELLGVLHTEHWCVGLLFLKAGKNVLCEKPFAMNSGQVKDLVAAAKKMEAIWSRCFPVHAELVKTAYFGSPQLHIPRSVKELGGGALLDIRVYCLQHESVITDKDPYPLHLMILHFFAFDELSDWINPKMHFLFPLQVLGPMHCPTTLLVNDKEIGYPLPEPLNFTNSTGLCCEAVLIILLKSSSSAGFEESPRMPLADSVGVAFSQDSQ